LIEMTDALHDSADLDDDLWRRLQAQFSEGQALDLFMLAGWDHRHRSRLELCPRRLEPGAPRFADVGTHATVGRRHLNPR
jgi:hypothetical protein